jgi:hypothetical protein
MVHEFATTTHCWLVAVCSQVAHFCPTSDHADWGILLHDYATKMIVIGCVVDRDLEIVGAADFVLAHIWMLLASVQHRHVFEASRCITIGPLSYLDDQLGAERTETHVCKSARSHSMC